MDDPVGMKRTLFCLAENRTIKLKSAVASVFPSSNGPINSVNIVHGVSLTKTMLGKVISNVQKR